MPLQSTPTERKKKKHCQTEGLLFVLFVNFVRALPIFWDFAFCIYVSGVHRWDRKLPFACWWGKTVLFSSEWKSRTHFWATCAKAFEREQTWPVCSVSVKKYWLQCLSVFTSSQGSRRYHPALKSTNHNTSSCCRVTERAKTHLLYKPLNSRNWHWKFPCLSFIYSLWSELKQLFSWTLWLTGHGQILNFCTYLPLPSPVGGIAQW